MTRSATAWEQIGPWHFPDEAAAFFQEVACRRYPFHLVYNTEDYLAILATQSGAQALGETRSTDFLARVRHRLESLGSPDLTAAFVGTVTIGRRTETGLPAAPAEGRSMALPHLR